MLHLNAFPQQTLFWNETLTVVLVWTLITYYHFIKAYTNRPNRKEIYIGYVFLVALAILCFRGYIVQYSYVKDGILYHSLGNAIYLIGVMSLTYISGGLYLLIKRYRSSTDPTDRNRTMYLIMGWSILILLTYSNLIPAVSGLPLDHIGSLANVLIITYAISKFNLLDVKFVMRRGLAFLLVIICLGGICAGLIFLEQKAFPNQPIYSIIGIPTMLVLLVALLAQRLRYGIQELIDRIFYGETYTYRQMLLKFNSKMGSILDLEQLAEAILPTVSKAIRITDTQLIFEDINSGDFTTQFTYPKIENESNNEFRLNLDSPIITWLEKESNPLSLRQIDNTPEFKALWETEKEKLIKSKIELLCPIKSRGKLIGILGLGKKQSNSPYSHEDIELVMNLAAQAGIIVENARLYSQAVTWAHTDGLTKLYNHRYLNERLEQEIARCSRFGTIFSLIMLDLDFFKIYNDTYGHLAGDEVLVDIGRCIQTSVRSVDMSFRYGGEEFAAILPETPLEGAYLVAERIRKKIESKSSSGKAPVTASFGVACWPTDGIMKEEIIASADTALYLAKQAGRNRICLSSDIKRSEATPVNMEDMANRNAISRVYTLAATVDAKDHHTYDHSKKVSWYVVAMAEAMNLPPDKIATIRTAGLLHDIGKIGVPDAILNKEGPLTEQEWEPIKAHVKLGVEIIKYVAELAKCLPIILNHHEHYDGSGYPSGLRGKQIPLEARLLAIADAYDAMTSSRPYHVQRTPQEAIDELKRCSGTQFDPELVNIFCKTIKLTISKAGEKK